jgi:hypothetical protein
MSLPSCREIRNQLFILVGAATAVLATTTVLLDGHNSFLNADTGPVATEDVNLQPGDDLAPIVTRNQVNWDDVNLSGRVNSPEDEVKTSRSKMLGDFEAR